MKKVLITQSNYIPWKGYFDMINTVDEFIIYDEMQYTKRDWRNRNKIKTPNRDIWLTIPVEIKGKYYQKIKEIKIADQNWSKKHWKTILYNYSNSKFFKEYRGYFEDLYLTMETKYLTEINCIFLKAIMKILNIETSIKFSKDFNLVEGKNEKIIEILKQTGATDYYSGPSAKDYINESLFNQNNIEVHYFDFTDYPVYTQLYGGFVHAVSIIDLIFNEGPDTKKFMKSF